MSMQTESGSLVESFAEFLSRYYEQDVAELAQHYPKERQSLYVEFADLYQYDADLADDYLEKPNQLHSELEYALTEVELPVDVSLGAAHVRVTDSKGYVDRMGVGELASEHTGNYVALRAQIGDVTGRMSRIEEAAFECQRCGTMTKVPQPFLKFQEPHQCQGCDREGPFSVNYTQSEFVDQRKVKLEEPPEEQVDGSGEEIIGYCLHDLVDVGGENGLQDKAGSRVTVLGEIRIDDRELFSRGDSEPVVDEYFLPKAFVFDDGEDEELDVEEHRDAVETFANRPDAVDVFRKSIDPGLEITKKWDMATEMATAWLFAAPRIDPENGDMIRGDLHMLFVSDPGMRKSVFAENLAELSPQCLLRDAGGMSSEVGLTSSASQDNFGDGKWTLTPGALPRANGGHLILDEIDKGPTEALGGIHGALEGDQKLKVNKADIQATLATRVGFMALGNPVEGRFDEYEPIAEQIDLDPALMSRFDLIVTMQDQPDKEVDDDIASGVLDSIDESARLEYGDLDESEAETVTPEVPRKVMQAWVKIARTEVNPLLTAGAKEILREFYVDTRQLNGEDSETPPATARTLVAGVRISMAFARCELSETVEERHAQRAVNLSKTVVGENFDPETGDFDADRTTETPSTQQQRVDAIREAIQGEQMTVEEIVEETGISKSKVENRVQKMYQNGKAIQPENGKFRLA